MSLLCVAGTLITKRKLFCFSKFFKYCQCKIVIAEARGPVENLDLGREREGRGSPYVMHYPLFIITCL